MICSSVLTRRVLHKLLQNQYISAQNATTRCPLSSTRPSCVSPNSEPSLAGVVQTVAFSMMRSTHPIPVRGSFEPTTTTKTTTQASLVRTSAQPHGGRRTMANAAPLGRTASVTDEPLSTCGCTRTGFRHCPSRARHGPWPIADRDRQQSVLPEDKASC